MGLINQTSSGIFLGMFGCGRNACRKHSITTTGQLLIVNIALPLHSLSKIPTEPASTSSALPAFRKGRDGPHQESKGPGWGRLLLRRWRRHIYYQKHLYSFVETVVRRPFSSALSVSPPPIPPISHKKAFLQKICASVGMLFLP